MHCLTLLLISQANENMSLTKHYLYRVAEFYQQGGPFMHPITLMSIFALAIIIERFISLYMIFSINAVKFWEDIRKLIINDNLNGAVKLCEKYRKTALARVFKSALENANKPDYEIQNAIDQAVLEVAPEIQKRIPYLSMAANVATLLGLLGTIIGLIQAFNALAYASPSEKQILLAKGISVAMNTTAFGLMVAIPSMFIYSILVNKATKLSDDIDEYSFKLLRLLSSLKEEAPEKIKVKV